MSTKNEIPEQGGNVNWEKLERQSQKSDGRRKVKKAKKESTPKEVEEEVKKLSDKDRALPYPEEFLAEVNLMRKGIDGGTIDVMSLPGDEDGFDDEDTDDEDFDDDDFDGDDDLDDDDDFDSDDDDDFDDEDLEDEDLEDLEDDDKND